MSLNWVGRWCEKTLKAQNETGEKGGRGHRSAAEKRWGSEIDKSITLAVRGNEGLLQASECAIKKTWNVFYREDDKSRPLDEESFRHGTMLHSTFKNLPSGSHADKNFILRLINLSSAGIGLISVWRKRKNHIPLQKTVFFQGGGGIQKRKTCRHQCVGEISTMWLK